MSVDSITTTASSQVTRQNEPTPSSATPVQTSSPRQVQEALVKASAASAEQSSERKNDDPKEKRVQLEAMAQNMQSFVQSFSKSVRFSVDSASGKDVISVIDQDSGELLRQIPSDEMLKLAVRLGQASGLLITEEV
jgi:flagellar protein FlaG